ncbi:MAG: hypothetical protein JNM36_04130 [Chitinophagales bacterium]|nr:hypothetical protein [Chitinophagales bacterium]
MLRTYHHAEGRIANISTGSNSPVLRYEYTLRDHLGNSRVSFSDISLPAGIEYDDRLQTNTYYPYGSTIAPLSSSNQFVPNDYKYNNKEYIDDLSLNMLDYGYRLLDPLTGRWNGVDALAERYHSSSGYGYVAGNPVLMVDPDGMRNMVYVVFLPSSGLNAAQKTAVIAEMQRIYDDVIGLKDSQGNSLIKVTEFNQAKRGKIYGMYIDYSDAIVAIGSVTDVNIVRKRSETSCYEMDENARVFVEYGDVCPELSENRRSLSDKEGKYRGQFVGISSDRTLKFSIKAKGTFIQSIAFLAVHGTGHNVNLGHDQEARYPGSLHLTVMADGDYIVYPSGGAKSLGFSKLSDWLNPTYNSILKPYFLEKFNGGYSEDKYNHNLFYNLTRLPW